MYCRVFFFKQKTAYEMRISDWSSDVCSSDLVTAIQDRKLIFDGGFGGGINIGRRDRDGRDVISQQVLSGDLTSKKAVEQLEQLRRIGRLTDEEFTAAATSVANLGLELEKDRKSTRLYSSH